MFNVQAGKFVVGSLSSGALGLTLSMSLLALGCGNVPSEAIPLALPKSESEFVKMRTESRALPVESDTLKTKEAQQSLEQARAEIRSLLRDQPERLVQIESAHLLRDEQIRVRADGNYDVTIQKKDGPATVVTMGEWFALGETARSLRVSQTQENRFTLFRQLREAIAPEHAGRLRLPTVADAQRFSSAELGDLVLRITSDSQVRFTATSKSPAESFGVSCGTEEGAGPMGDGAASCGHDPSGIFANVAFAMRDHQTCVKNQGNRGTCVSFAIAGAMETSASLQHGRRINLSEQDLYRYAKFALGTGGYGDGLPTGDAVEKAKSYIFAWEGEWTYNPSYSRYDSGSYYANSCVGYSGPYCSDSNHQAYVYCFYGSCWYIDTAPKSSGFTVRSRGELGTDLLGRFTAATMLASNIAPVVLSFYVTPSFDRASGGVVGYRSGEGNRGSHAMLLVGYVPNSDLPAGIPAADGGGYFIGRNSWGCGFGDGGYVYLPQSFIAEYGHSMIELVSN